jgi:diguanylate cyclase (GGDEF)-like protein
MGSLRVKLALVILVVVALGSLASTYYMRDRLNDRYDESVQTELESVGHTLSAQLTTGDIVKPGELQGRLNRVRAANPQITGLTVFRTDEGTPSAVASSFGDKPKSLESAKVPLVNGQGSKIGLVEVQLDRASSDHALAGDIRRLMLVSLAIAAMVVLLFSVLLGRVVLNPLRQLREAIGAIRRGAGSTHLGWRRSDELGVLSNDFDAMAAELKKTHSRLEALADSDPLTGLLNHRSFHEALGRELSRATRENSPLALVVLDLDHFKSINDVFGHPYGDELLRKVARRLTETMRGEDLVARIGGEEFGVILPGKNAEQALVVAERARDCLSDVPVQGGRTLSSSAGLAVFPADAPDGASLLAMADGALYWAKRTGRDQTRCFDPEHVAPVADPAQELAEVQGILDQPELLKAVYQPWVELATGRLGGYEALSRFEAPVQRRPDEWFALAHRCGLGQELEALALSHALSSPDRPRDTFLSLNISPSMLTSPVVQAALPESLDLIIIEVTEQQEIVDLPGVELALREFRGRGAQIALDDTGVGYAGLEELMRLRPDIIKLDRSLITSVADEPAKAALVESLVRFAQRTDAAVCAEGVETLEELEVLADLDVTYGQGYLLARPAPAWVVPDAEAVEALKRRSARGGLDMLAGSREAIDQGLEHVCAHISSCATLDDLRGVFSLIGTELGSEDVALSRWDRENDQVTTTLAGPRWPEAGDESYLLSEYPTTRHVLMESEAAQVLVNDPAADPAEAALLREWGFGTVLMVPVAFGGVTIGLLEVARTQAHAFTRTQINRARIIGYQLGGMVATGRMDMQADGSAHALAAGVAAATATEAA